MERANRTKQQPAEWTNECTERDQCSVDFSVHIYSWERLWLELKATATVIVANTYSFLFLLGEFDSLTHTHTHSFIHKSQCLSIWANFLLLHDTNINLILLWLFFPSRFVLFFCLFVIICCCVQPTKIAIWIPRIFPYLYTSFGHNRTIHAVVLSRSLFFDANIYN